MNVRLFSYLSDNEAVVRWLSKYSDWPQPLPKEYMSETGFIVEEGGEKLAVCWLIMTNAKMAWVAWPMVNPDAHKEKRREALDLIFSTIKREAAEKGYTHLLTTTNIPSLVNRYKKHGFNVGDEGVTQLIARIK